MSYSVKDSLNSTVTTSFLFKVIFYIAKSRLLQPRSTCSPRTCSTHLQQHPHPHCSSWCSSEPRGTTRWIWCYTLPQTINLQQRCALHFLLWEKPNHSFTCILSAENTSHMLYWAKLKEENGAMCKHIHYVMSRNSFFPGGPTQATDISKLFKLGKMTDTDASGRTRSQHSTQHFKRFLRQFSSLPLNMTLPLVNTFKSILTLSQSVLCMWLLR